MGITVADIEQKEFAFKGAGYDPYDVDSYLDQICDEMIALQDRIDALEGDLKKANAALAVANEAVKPIPQEVVRTETNTPVAKTSETLENILLSAQRISDEAIENAKKQAEKIVEEAQNKATELMDNAQEERGTLQKELQTLRDAAGDYKKRFMSLLNEHKSMLENSGDIFAEEEASTKAKEPTPSAGRGSAKKS